MTERIIPGKTNGEIVKGKEQPWLACIQPECLSDPCLLRVTGEKQCPAIIKPVSLRWPTNITAAKAGPC